MLSICVNSHRRQTLLDEVLSPVCTSCFVSCECTLCFSVSSFGTGDSSRANTPRVRHSPRLPLDGRATPDWAPQRFLFFKRRPSTARESSGSSQRGSTDPSSFTPGGFSPLALEFDSPARPSPADELIVFGDDPNGDDTARSPIFDAPRGGFGSISPPDSIPFTPKQNSKEKSLFVLLTLQNQLAHSFQKNLVDCFLAAVERILIFLLILSWERNTQKK